MQIRIFLNRIKEGEGLFQEFKESFERIDRTMVAFANAKGGIIYLGVRDDGKLLSFYLTNSIRAKIEAIARNIDPPLSVECRDLGGAVAIVVAEGEDNRVRGGPFERASVCPRNRAYGSRTRLFRQT